MNGPSVIQSQQSKWMEVILLCLGILIPIQVGPVVYRSLQHSSSTPEILLNSLGALLILALNIGLFLKYETLSHWILNAASSNTEKSMRDSELSGWLAMGIFTIGLLFLIHAIALLFFLFGGQLSLWYTLRRNGIGMTERKIWFFITILALNHVPRLTIFRFLTFFPQPLARWTISLQERWGSWKNERPPS